MDMDQKGTGKSFDRLKAAVTISTTAKLRKLLRDAQFPASIHNVVYAELQNRRLKRAA